MKIKKDFIHLIEYANIVSDLGVKKINIIKNPFQLRLGHVCQILLLFFLFLYCFKEKSFWFASHFGRAKYLVSFLSCFFQMK